MSFKHFLGYDRGQNGQPVINEKQAELVRRIYSMYVKDIIFRVFEELYKEKNGINKLVLYSCNY